MELLGDWNWWIPKWLDRILPRVHVEGEQLTEDDLAALEGESEPTPV
jgi:RND superfamily putative drug exporter